MIQNSLWVEKFRPKTIADYVFKDKHQESIIRQWITEKNIPNLLLEGPPGTGKTSIAKVLFAELEIDPSDILYLNGSSQNGVDIIRDTITNFVSVMPFGDFRIVFLDECLDEDTLVTILRFGKVLKIKIKNLQSDTDLVKSYNVENQRIEWKSFELFDKGIQDVLEIEFENGERCICTYDHKWYVYDHKNELKIVTAKELELYDHIITIED